MDIASMGEELRDAKTALPKVGSTGLVVVFAVYLLMNVAYLAGAPGGGHRGR
jgi:amino acid transporter